MLRCRSPASIQTDSVRRGRRHGRRALSRSRLRGGPGARGPTTTRAAPRSSTSPRACSRNVGTTRPRSATWRRRPVCSAAACTTTSAARRTCCSTSTSGSSSRCSTPHTRSRRVELPPDQTVRALAAALVHDIADYRDQVTVALHEWRTIVASKDRERVARVRRARREFEEVVARAMERGRAEGTFAFERPRLAVLGFLG